ncbi:DUF397 domain-containing protein [Nonomuraea antimicrobica]
MLTKIWVTASESGGCVEVARAADGVGVQVRNSREPDGAILVFTPGEWRDFVNGVRRGQGFDLPEWHAPVSLGDA